MELVVRVLILFSLSSTFFSFANCDSSSAAISCAVGLNSYHKKDIISAVYALTNNNDIYQAQGYVTFRLHSRENVNGQEILIDEPELLQTAFFKKSRPTKMITHGYLNSGTSPACKLSLNAFLNSGDYNIIVVDWWNMQSIWGVLPLSYNRAVSHVKEVGIYVARMIDFLESQGMSTDSTTLIGHSLGAHVMGIAGHYAKSRIKYIVGLDPALPLFESRDEGDRLSITDARIVEVIHTNVGDCGYINQLGHYDFYPNGGSKQPGCILNQCSHARAYELFAESISSDSGFFGRKCTDLKSAKEGNCTGSLAKMGGNDESTGIQKRSISEGMYYLETRDSSPYAMGV
ncbi:hypothetical protein QAD02_005356 [Eretmocerus hayati]|uniref:Uncharacterized protein n=1 Tax=Eretmocerus hayati TaxID=131215 RepID=A0ACC2NS57_9HYME|nr:hypothetical protein QAD02_005356 [Eretmocerus hayati]